MSEGNDGAKQDAGACGPGCCCGTTGAGSRMKWVVCGIVALAAIVTVTAHVSRTRAAKGQVKPQGYAVSIPVTGEPAETKPTAVAEAWGAPLKGLAELNVVASNTEAVFVVVPSGDDARTKTIRKEVTAAAATIATRGTKMGTFLLSKDAREYAALAQQVGTPAVLAMCKGMGMAVVPDKDVTLENLLKAFVGASRPSSCGPSASGCGPDKTTCK